MHVRAFHFREWDIVQHGERHFGVCGGRQRHQNQLGLLYNDINYLNVHEIVVWAKAGCLCGRLLATAMSYNTLLQPHHPKPLNHDDLGCLLCLLHLLHGAPKHIRLHGHIHHFSPIWPGPQLDQLVVSELSQH